MPQRITVYSTNWCGSCHSAKRFLRDHDVSFKEIDIDQDELSAQKVIDWSGGRRVVPTFEIDCQDSTIILHNPNLRDLAKSVGVGA